LVEEREWDGKARRCRRLLVTGRIGIHRFIGDWANCTELRSDGRTRQEIDLLRDTVALDLL